MHGIWEMKSKYKKYGLITLCMEYVMHGIWGIEVFIFSQV